MQMGMKNKKNHFNGKQNPTNVILLKVLVLFYYLLFLNFSFSHAGPELPMQPTLASDLQGSSAPVSLELGYSFGPPQLVSTQLTTLHFKVGQHSSITYFSHHLGGNDSFTHNCLSSSFDPVYGSRFLVGAIVTTNCQDLHLRKELLKLQKRFLRALERSKTTCVIESPF